MSFFIALEKLQNNQREREREREREKEINSKSIRTQALLKAILAAISSRIRRDNFQALNWIGDSVEQLPARMKTMGPIV